MQPGILYRLALRLRAASEKLREWLLEVTREL